VGGGGGGGGGGWGVVGGVGATLAFTCKVPFFCFFVWASCLGMRLYPALKRYSRSSIGFREDR